MLRLRAGDRVRATLRNELLQHTSIHWHGVRVPNAMDGVPYLTQAPVRTGESFTYEFTVPDTGTNFIHPHCNESGQTGRGLLGVLLVEGDTPDGYADADIVLALKDWRLAEDGAFLPFETSQGASRAGTFGTLRGANGRIGPATADVTAGGDIRLRLFNLDATRIAEVGIEGAEAAVIAIDGNAVAPFPLDTWRLGPAMRLDLLVRAPAKPGAAFRVIDYFAAEPWTLATYAVAAAPALFPSRPSFDPGPLHASSAPRADPRSAERMSFRLSATSTSGAAAAVLENLPDGDPLAKVLMDSLCVRDTAFWAINKASWPTGDHRAVPPPLATLRAGRSYLFEIANDTPHPHPMHLHGHTFEVLATSRLRRPRHQADTVLVNPKERVEIAFVAAQGNWMFHCHVLEHLEHGMMGYLRVV